ncbi:MAG: hypothetical protein QW058_03355, partial [Candidatus Aenigmatarchaeota archaeon]
MKLSSNVSKLTFFLVLSSLLMLPLSLAATDEATVNVTVQALAQIAVQPKTLNWTVYAGQAGVEQILDIYNIGSINVTQIYAYVDTLEDETQRPYGSANATNYAAGGVIVFKNETYNKFFFAGRIEWNWTEDISNLNKNNV